MPVYLGLVEPPEVAKLAAGGSPDPLKQNIMMKPLHYYVISDEFVYIFGV